MVNHLTCVSLCVIFFIHTINAIKTKSSKAVFPAWNLLSGDDNIWTNLVHMIFFKFSQTAVTATGPDKVDMKDLDGVESRTETGMSYFQGVLCDPFLSLQPSPSDALVFAQEATD